MGIYSWSEKKLNFYPFSASLECFTFTQTETKHKITDRSACRLPGTVSRGELSTWTTATLRGSERLHREYLQSPLEGDCMCH